MTRIVVARRVAEIRARVSRVRELLPATAVELSERRTESEALILNLYLALQAANDRSLHLVAERGLGVPGDARGAYELLAQAGMVETALARRMAGAVGLRNRIAHQYGSLELERIFEIARDDLDDLMKFARAVSELAGL